MGGEEAARLGGDEGERVGREIAGDEGARIGREVGAEAARLAGAKHGRRVGKLEGIKAGVSAAKIACVEHARLCAKEISREKVLAMVSKGQIRVSSQWRPTSLIGVINARSDLTDIEKVQLAAKAKMDGNISDLLPKSLGVQSHVDDPLVGKLKFSESSSQISKGDEDAAGRKWSTVVFSDVPNGQQRKGGFDMTQDNVNSLKRRFETKNMKNNEAYVIL